MSLVLMLEERPEKSAPTLTLARNLESLGYETVFSGDIGALGIREWARLCRRASVLIMVNYYYLDTFLVRQLAVAVSLGRPLVRWWVGTDVFNALERPLIAESARSSRWMFSRQIAVSPHLVDELETIGIQAQYIPSVCELDTVATVLNNVPGSILVYLPGKRREFYGSDLVEEAIKAYPDIEFVIVADEAHSLAAYPNVRSMGWVSDMEEIWDSVGGLLRMTSHDGMPRMVLEALRRGKHVIYAWPFPGCILAESRDEVFRALDDFRRQTSVNLDGISQVQKLLASDPAARFGAVLAEVLDERKPVRCIRGIGAAVTHTCRMKTRSRVYLTG